MMPFSTTSSQSASRVLLSLFSVLLLSTARGMLEDETNAREIDYETRQAWFDARTRENERGLEFSPDPAYDEFASSCQVLPYGFCTPNATGTDPFCCCDGSCRTLQDCCYDFGTTDAPTCAPSDSSKGKGSSRRRNLRAGSKGSKGSLCSGKGGKGGKGGSKGKSTSSPTVTNSPTSGKAGKGGKGGKGTSSPTVTSSPTSGKAGSKGGMMSGKGTSSPTVTSSPTNGKAGSKGGMSGKGTSSPTKSTYY